MVNELQTPAGRNACRLHAAGREALREKGSAIG
jgi:hypothetical protein